MRSNKSFRGSAKNPKKITDYVSLCCMVSYKPNSTLRCRIDNHSVEKRLTWPGDSNGNTSMLMSDSTVRLFFTYQVSIRVNRSKHGEDS